MAERLKVSPATLYRHLPVARAQVIEQASEAEGNA
ncbi:hypothetical protein [Pontibaca methylaminivorans]|nr:hypothetical protein [Pontibaca methylaminivorans]